MNKPTDKFVAYGHLVESEIDIIGADRCLAKTAYPADIRIMAGAPYATPGSDADVYWLAGDTLDFLPPGVGRYRCRGGDSIEVSITPGADPAKVQGLLIATALPALLWMRGAFVLHAAAVTLPGSDLGVVIAGPSGIGKSTIVEQLIKRGARLIADDTVCLSLSKATISASGLCGGYFIGEFLGEPRKFKEVSVSARCHHAPLGAVLFLSRRSEPGSVTRMSGVRAVESLLLNRHRPKVPDMLGLHACGLQSCALIANRVPAYHWQRRDSAPALSAIEMAMLTRLVMGEQ